MLNVFITILFQQRYIDGNLQAYFIPYLIVELQSHECPSFPFAVHTHEPNWKTVFKEIKKK
jgi:hypothetical protein